MPKWRYPKQAYSVSPEFLEGSKKPEYQPEKEEVKIASKKKEG